ncbi:MAG: FlgD immunoglobulin-like domain containing protein [Calditrichia bacterium]
MRQIFAILFISLGLFAQENLPIFSSDFSEDKSDGEIAQATVDYWESFYQENYFDKGYSFEDMGGTGYYPFRRMKHFYDMRKNENGEIPFLSRWNAYEQSKQQLLDNKSAILTASWESMGPNTIDTLAGRMLAHAFDPLDNKIIWAGSGSGGLWKSLNAGESWIPVTDHLPSLRISAIAINPNDRDMIIIGTGTGMGNSFTLQPGVGILKSTDGGLTWQQTSFTYMQSQGVSTFKMIWDKSNPSRLYVAATNGTWISDDQGDTWQRTFVTRTTDIKVNKQSPNILYMASQNAGIYRSTDFGTTWGRLNSGLPNSTQIGFSRVAICDSFPNVLYAGIADATTQAVRGLYRSDDGGDSWMQLSNVPNVYCQPGATTSCQGWFSNTLGVSPADPDLIFFGGVQFWRSDDGGSTWTWHDYLSNGTGTGNMGLVYVDQMDIGFDPVDPQTIYVFNDGGIQKSTDNGLWWERINQDLVTAQLYGIASSQTVPERMIGGFQDHGLQKVDGRGGNLAWKRWTTFDGAGGNIDHQNSDIIYGVWNLGTHFKSLDFGNSAFPIMNGITEGGVWLTPQVMHPEDPKILYTASTLKIYKTVNGANWTAVAAIPNVNTIAIDQVNPDIIYAHSYTGTSWTIWRSNDAGANWAAINDPTIPSWRVRDLEADPSNEGIVYAVRNSAFANRDHVKKSVDYGNTWQDITNNLPDIPTNAIAISPFNSDHLYLATDLGIYLSTNGGGEWLEYNDGLPLVYASDIHYHPVDSTLRIATLGRGVWKSRSADVTVGVAPNQQSSIPNRFSIEQNYPNPFNPETVVNYELFASAAVQVEVFNELGQSVAFLYEGNKAAGRHQLTWDGRNDIGNVVATGNYFLRITADGIAKTIKMNFVK